MVTKIVGQYLGVILHAATRCEACGRMHSRDIACDDAYEAFKIEHENSDRF